MMTNKFVFSVLSVVAFLLVGCENQTSSNSSAPTNAAVSVDAMPSSQSSLAMMGDEIVFSSQLPEQKKINLIGGWSILEPWGVWSDGKKAILSIAAKDLPEHFKIAIAYVGFVAENHKEQFYEMEDSKGDVLAKFNFSVGEGQKIKEVVINKKQTIDAEGNIVLTIKMLNPLTPVEAGMPSGERLLGMGMSSIKILPA
jgi:hypothetical protein